jgi:hypothetical protein
VLTLGLAGTAVGCADDGRALRDPESDQTTTTAGPTTTAPPASGDAGSVAATATVRLTSDGFTDGGVIPDEYTCRGAGTSPPLLWTGVPLGVSELALIVRDEDAEGAVQWVVTGIPAQVGGIAEGTPPEESAEALNAFGGTGYAAPCPDAGTHHYEFRLYAFAQPLGVQPGAPGDIVADNIESSPNVGSAALSGTVTAD